MSIWVTNCLTVQCDNEAANQVIESLLDGSVVDRHEELSRKLRQIALAGLVGILVPSPHVDLHALDGAAKLHPNFATDRRESSDRARAYDAFLIALVSGGLSPDTYDELSDLFDRTQLAQLWWGDIPRIRRRALSEIWKQVHYSYWGGYDGDVVRWWSAPASPYSTSERGLLNIALLHPIPVSVVVNGFNGRLLDALSLYRWNSTVLNTKWTTVGVKRTDSGHYRFNTAWAPARCLTTFLPRYVVGCLGLDDDEDAFNLVRCNLYYFAGNSGFQGINDEHFDIDCEYDEESDSYAAVYHPEIVSAFDGYL